MCHLAQMTQKSNQCNNVSTLWKAFKFCAGDAKRVSTFVKMVTERRILHVKKAVSMFYGWMCLLPFLLNRSYSPEPRLIAITNTDLKQICTSYFLSHHITDEERWARMPFACKRQRNTDLKSSKTSQKPTAHTAGKTGKDRYWWPWTNSN